MINEIQDTEQFRPLLNKLRELARIPNIWKDRKIFGAAFYADYGSLSGVFFQIKGSPDKGTVVLRFHDRILLEAVVIYAGTTRLYSSGQQSQRALKAKEIAEEIVALIPSRPLR